MIEIKHLYKKYGNKQIFNDLNITISDGEFVILIGESGCGKTTLLNIIGAIESPESGKILVNGIDITKRKNQKNYFENTVGFLFQNFALIENKSVRKNLELVPTKNRTEIAIAKALELVGLENNENDMVYTLSGGEQQRLALARLMIKKCDIILADEPTGSLDTKNTQIVLNILRELNRQGKTILLVTHDERIINSGERVIKL